MCIAKTFYLDVILLEKSKLFPREDFQISENSINCIFLWFLGFIHVLVYNYR